MRWNFALFVFAPLVIPLRAAAAPAYQLEAGANYFMLRGAHFEPAPAPLSVDEPDRLAPLVALRAAFTDKVSLRLSYQRLNAVRATVQYGYPPGNPSSPLPVIVWGHYDDDVHVVSFAPEFRWPIASRLAFSIAPQINWVTSRGVIRYSTDNALILLQAPRSRNESGATFGGGVRVDRALGSKCTAFAGYQFIDLEPSFEREAHVLSAGLTWTF